MLHCIGLKEIIMSTERLSHGDTVHFEPIGIAPPADDAVPAALPLNEQHWPFGFLFGDLQSDPSNLLPEHQEMVANLRNLGDTMRDDNTAEGTPVPSVYTFLGQFIDHDITLEKSSETIRDISKPELSPISLDEIHEKIVNSRSPNLDLDSVYSSPAARDPSNEKKMRIDAVALPNLRPVGKSPFNDLPRMAPSDDAKTDRVALIGDKRNDENLIISQLHVAFLRAHNALVDQTDSFDDARKLLIQHYQWIVLDDFLNRIADPDIVENIRDRKQFRFFDPTPEKFFMPLEFSAAAYRFGHSKVRSFYPRYNRFQKQTALEMLFTISRSSGNLAGFDHITGIWIIEWENFLRSDDSSFFPRPIDTTLSKPLLNIGGQNGQPGFNLATANLLRGYILRMPTGQAVAKSMWQVGIEPLTPDQIESVAVKLKDNGKQLEALRKGNFQYETPLWFYILAEAAYYHGGKHLGPVGSTIVAEVLIGVLRNSEYSILGEPDWEPRLKGRVEGKFDLADLLILAGVLKPKPD
jgi:Animal haem peroxidase